MVEYIENKIERRNITKYTLSQLPEWFGIEESLNDYISIVSTYPFLAYRNEYNEIIGFYSLKPTSNVVLDIYVCSVIPSMHRKGVGKALQNSAEKYGKSHGYKYMQVKTVAMGHFGVYDLTNRFYLSLGFEPFEILPTLWDVSNPCQIYLKSIE